MTVYARRFVATPVRSASEVWNKMIQLLAPQQDSVARAELIAISGVVCSLISDETAKTAPIVVYGSGPRVRLYCLYDQDALTGDNANESTLPFNATENDWNMSLPCLVTDLEWVQNTLKPLSTRVTARDMDAPIEDEKTESSASTTTLQVDKEAFFRP